MPSGSLDTQDGGIGFILIMMMAVPPTTCVLMVWYAIFDNHGWTVSSLLSFVFRQSSRLCLRCWRACLRVRPRRKRWAMRRLRQHSARHRLGMRARVMADPEAAPEAVATTVSLDGASVFPAAEVPFVISPGEELPASTGTSGVKPPRPTSRRQRAGCRHRLIGRGTTNYS